MAALLPILLDLLPGILGGGFLIWAYFAVKRKGARQERELLEKAQAEAKAKQIERVGEAVSQDAAIDKRVADQVEAIKIPIHRSDSGDTFKF